MAVISKLMDPRERVAVALDVHSSKEAMTLLDLLGDQCRWVKIGMELFYAEGPRVVEQTRARHIQVFLDLKLHDIPNTVASAIRSLARLDVQLLTVHAQGGPDMLLAAQEATAAHGGPKLLAVTVLTSMDSSTLAQVGVDAEPPDQVIRLARLATDCGIPGIVCSPLEAASLRSSMGDGPFIVTPGVRQHDSGSDDQKRTSTVASAIQNGSSMLVIGRPITRATHPAAALDSILQQIAGAASYAERR